MDCSIILFLNQKKLDCSFLGLYQRLCTIYLKKDNIIIIMVNEVKRVDKSKNG